MKRKISYILITVMLVLQFCGCGANTENQQDITNTEEVQSNGETVNQKEFEVQESILDVRAISELSRRDNSLDVYSWVVDAPLQVEKPATALVGGGFKLFLGKSRAYYFQKHLFKNVEQCWDELAFLTAEGVAGTTGFDRENQLWGIGPVCGTDHYITLGYVLQEGEKDNYRCFIAERNEDHEIQREVPLDFLGGNDLFEVLMSLSDFAVDGSGIIHLLQNMGEEWLIDHLKSRVGLYLGERN